MSWHPQPVRVGETRRRRRRYNALKTRMALLQAHASDLQATIKAKNPSLLLGLGKGKGPQAQPPTSAHATSSRGGYRR